MIRAKLLCLRKKEIVAASAGACPPPMIVGQTSMEPLSFGIILLILYSLEYTYGAFYSPSIIHVQIS